MYRVVCLLGRIAIVCLTLIMLFMCSNAIADESMQVSIPVVAYGYDCTVALYDEGGHRVQFLNLRAGQESAFVVDCVGLKRFTYTAMVTNDDLPNVKFDRRNYRITIDLIYNENDELCAMIFIENLTSDECKLPGLEFHNNLITYPFIFHKVWSGDHEDSIDWTMYNPDGTTKESNFIQYVVSEDYWRYQATFYSNVDGCYVIENPPDGYIAYYENIGEYADVTDRCYNGGTIINVKVPQTGDSAPIAVYYMLVVLSMIGLLFVAKKFRQMQYSDKT